MCAFSEVKTEIPDKSPLPMEGVFVLKRIQLLAMCGLMGFFGAALFQWVPAPKNVEAATGTWNYGRSFYLTKQTYQGNAALTACATGYHMASLYEVYDLAGLKYNTTLGLTLADSGSGPPAYSHSVNTYGWIRTGDDSSNGGGPGEGNCSAWTSNSGSDYGSAVRLVGLFYAPGPGTNVLVPAPNPWVNYLPNPYVTPPYCSASLLVWCVQN
jgi:hypothetical protein